MIGAAHGLDNTGYTTADVATWAHSVRGKNPTDVVQATADKVCKAAGETLDRLKTPRLGDGTPAGLSANNPVVPSQGATVAVDEPGPQAKERAQRDRSGLEVPALTPASLPSEPRYVTCRSQARPDRPRPRVGKAPT